MSRVWDKCVMNDAEKGSNTEEPNMAALVVSLLETSD